MTPLRTTLTLLFLVAAILLMAGCTIGEKSAGPEPKTVVFPSDPIPLSGQFRPTDSLSSFEDSFIGSLDCTEEAETYSANFTLITGYQGPERIKYTLVPVEYAGTLKEVPPSPDIIRASIEPDEFTAEPSKIYTSRFSITIGPNVTGESWTTAQGVAMRNPSFTYRVKVSVNGSDDPGLGDGINIRKWCYLHSQTGDMQGMPSWELKPHDFVVRAGGKKESTITIRNFGGGIRELQLKVPGLLKGPGFDCLLDADPNQLLPMPEGMNISFVPPVFTGRNFHLDSNTMVISTTPGTPAGTYHFPLILCYRDMDLVNRNSSQLPFSEKLWCPSCGDFIVTVESG
jgi:hypothetical protein